MRLNSLLLLLFWTLACKEPAPPASAAIYAIAPATHVSTWDQSLLGRPLPARIEPATEPLLDYIRRWNESDGFQAVPKPARMDAKDKEALARELANLPPPVLKLLQKHVITIATVEDLGGSAMAGAAFDDKGEFPFGFLILDINMFKRNANQWISYKENTVFQPEPGTSYNVILEPEVSNTRIAGMRFVILHELGHIIAQVTRSLPAFTDRRPDVNKFPFARTFDEFPLRKRIKFYADKPPFSVKEAEKLYDEFSPTRFPTLYSCVDEEEDFSETFALYIHTVLMKKPYEVKLIEKGKTTLLARDRILLPQMKEKRDFIARILEK